MIGTADQQTYRRAANAALVGLGVQFVLATAAALIGLWAQSPALHAATWHLCAGLPIWVVLLLIYHQHRIERTEALEAEQIIRRDQAAAAIFEEHADDLDLARRRLDRLYKWGLGIVSFVVAGFLLIAGGILLNHARTLLGGVRLSESNLLAQAVGAGVNLRWLMAIILPVAFVAFITARYMAGMTSAREFILLRGGASYLMGSFVIAGLLFLSVLAQVALGNREVLALMALVIPALMMLIGIEILLTFLLSAYRPRKAGEIARPAFDSRVLGLLTSPESLASIINEAINYQFGFEISRSWFYQVLSKAVTPLFIAGLLMLALVSCVVIVQPHEQAVISHRGNIARVVGSGLHLKMPWPLASARKYEVGRVHTLSVGSSKSKVGPNVAILWTNEHTEGQEQYLITVPPRAREPHDQQAGGTPGTSLLAAEISVQYRIRDLEKYLVSAGKPTAALENIADRITNQYFATHYQDDLLSGQRAEAGDTLRQRIQQEADRWGLGLEVTFVGFVGVHPPQKEEVAKSFHTQIGAIQERETLISEARRNANRTLAEVAGSADQAQAINSAILQLETLKADAAVTPEQLHDQETAIYDLLAAAQGEAAKLIFDARAYRWERAITERAKAEKFLAESLAFDKAPAYYRARRHLDALSAGLQEARKIITAAQGDKPIIRLDLKDDRTGLETILKPN